MTIRFWLVTCLIIGTLFSALPTLAREHSLEVVGNTELSRASSPYFFDAVHVADGAKLTIEPGVQLILAENALVTVDGTIVSEGSSEQPILWTGQDVSHSWSHLHISSSSPASVFTFTTFRYFSDALVIDTPQTTFNHDSFIDGKRNLLEINGTADPISLHLEELTFANQNLGGDMHDNGLLFQGHFQDIHVRNIFFQDARMLSSLYILGLRAVGAVSTLEADGVWFATCPSTIHTNGLGTRIDVVLNQAHCSWKNIPVVFVPGYGTSIDLQKLTNPEDRAVGGSWHFLNGLTPAYTQFLNDLTHNQIPYEVAYYDWRLPIQDIVRGYLLPVIAKAKQETGSSQVYIVAHSYGGLVSRAYIQGDHYQQDVAQLVELGTPNLGAAKAYSVWEAGVLPDDWSALNNIILWYEWLERDHAYSRMALIRTFFPSAQDLLPIYPAVTYAGTTLKPEEAVYPNTTLLSLSQTIATLSERTKTTLVFSQSDPTLTQFAVKGPPNPLAPIWADGEPAVLPPPLDGLGDGTVPEVSAHLPDFPSIEVTGEHSLLPAAASSQVIALLYPQLGFHSSQLGQNSTHWFVFDCPLTVTITLPDGRQRSSTEENGPQGLGEVEESDQLLWMLLPAEDGEYQIHVQATASTEVRFWVDHDPIHLKTMQAGEIWNVSYPIHSALMPSPLPTPTTEAQLSPLSTQPPSSQPTVAAVFWTPSPMTETTFSSPVLSTKKTVTAIRLIPTKTPRKADMLLGVWVGVALLILWGNRRE